MQNSAARTSLWLIMGGLVCQTAAAQQTPSYFKSSSPIQSTEVVVLSPATTPSPEPSPAIQVPAPTLGNGGAGTPVPSPEKMKLDEALGLPTYPSKESEEKFCQFLQLIPAAPTAAVPTYGQQLNTIRQCLQNRRTQEALRALRGAAACNASDGHADADLADWVKSALELRTNLVLQQTKDEQARMREIHATANADVLTAEIASAAKTKAPFSSGRTPTKAPFPSGRTPTPVEPTPPPTLVMTETSEIEKQLRLKIEQLEVAEAQQEREKSQSEVQQSLESANIRFTDLVHRFCTEHKYEQVTLALPFYRQIFGTEQCPVGTMEEAVTAQAVIDQTDALMRMAVAKSDASKIEAATAAVYRAFADGEYQPAVIDLDAKVRTRVKTFLTAAETVRHGVEARDFELTEKYVDSIRRVAPDFDPAKLLALLRTYESESNLHVGNATRALREKNFQTAKQEWCSARNAWRNNPALDAFPGFMHTAGDVHQQALDFDRLLKARDYRNLYENRQLYTEFLGEDAVRFGQLQSAIETVQRMDLSIAQINRTRQAGDICGAWELAEGASKEWPDDVSLRESFTRLSREGAAYAEAIGRARQAEALKQYGYSLAWYVAAQRIYPASVPAQQAFFRLSGEVFASAKPGTFVMTASQ